MNAIKLVAATLCLTAMICSSSSAGVTFAREQLKPAVKQTAKDCKPNQIFGKDNFCHDKTVKPMCPGGYSLTGTVCTYAG